MKRVAERERAARLAEGKSGPVELDKDKDRPITSSWERSEGRAWYESVTEPRRKPYEEPIDPVRGVFVPKSITSHDLDLQFRVVLRSSWRQRRPTLQRLILPQTSTVLPRRPRPCSWPSRRVAYRLVEGQDGEGRRDRTERSPLCPTILSP
jgi:hypothetical protein